MFTDLHLDPRGATWRALTLLVPPALAPLTGRETGKTRTFTLLEPARVEEVA